MRSSVGPVAASFESARGRGTGTIHNVSREGVFVAAETLPQPDEVVTVSFTDLQQQVVQISGTVRWTTAQIDPARRHRPGFGVRLHAADDRFKAFFRQILES